MSSEIHLPLLAHSDTVSRCGVFCSFISTTECCKTEGIVDVFQVAKALCIQKPGSVLTVVSMSSLSSCSPVLSNCAGCNRPHCIYTWCIGLFPIILLHNQYCLLCIQFMTVGLTSQLLYFSCRNSIVSYLIWCFCFLSHSTFTQISSNILRSQHRHWTWKTA